MTKNQEKQLILASASPRRVDLLKQAGITPDEIIPADIDEKPLKGELPRDLAQRLAEHKALKVYKQICLPRESGDLKNDNKDARFRGQDNNSFYILAADTVVACGRRLLDKAEDPGYARLCLETLSGRRHHVYGAICLITPDGKTVKRLVDTIVQFKRLTTADIDKYIETGEWRGKAGGYAIQGYAERYIKFIHGSYSNVVGLSLYDTINILDGAGFKTPK